MGEFGIFVIIFLAFAPFVLVVMKKPRLVLEEPPFTLDEEVITSFPTCFHCGWQGALDVTEFVQAGARMEGLTIMKSPPCPKCGRRWKINLTTLVQKYRTGALFEIKIGGSAWRRSDNSSGI